MSDYTPTGVPVADSAGVSSEIRAEFALIQTAIATKLDGVGDTGIVTVGTITTGTWNATDIAVASGGTGRSTSTTAYGLLAAGTTATGAHQTLAAGATTEILVGGGAAALPVWTAATGSGAPVRATSPTLTTPDIGTPSAATLTNATGLPVTTGVSGLGTGVATFLATPSSANLAAAVTGETGTGALVFAESPTLVTPALGTPSSGTLTNCTGLPVAGLATSAIVSVPMINGYIEWSIAANALTAAVKTLAGTDPTATDPVFAVFRDPTLTTAGYYVRSITAALSVVASSGSTLGTVSAQASRIRAVLMDNAGTVVLGLYNPWVDSTKSLKGLDEGLVYSSTAEGGAGAADSAQVIYTTSAQTSKAIREVSYMDSTQTTAGTWAQALTNKVQITATTPKTGAVLQTSQTISGAVVTGTTVMPNDDTIPQNTEGVAFTALDTAITATSASNVVDVGVLIAQTSSTGSAQYILALFEGTVANALAVSTCQPGVSSVAQMCIQGYRKIVNTSSAKTFKTRVGGPAAGTQTINGDASARKFGGVLWSNCIVKEIMV